MASRASYDFAVILIVLLFIFPVYALPQDVAALTGDSITASTPATPYTIVLFIPSSNQVHSDQIKDQINDPNGDVVLATSYGLSAFDGTWSTRHINLDNISQGLMDDFVTAVEYDHQGRLWIGYSGGIQIYDGAYYQVIRDQQLLKDTQIRDLQRWNNEMWIATGNAGIQRYRDGEWTWFQPMIQGGAGFYEIDSMTLDTESNSLVIATEKEGLWIVRSQEDPVHFEMLAGKDSAAGQMQHVKRDPLGGVYFFNPGKIIHFDTESGFKDILTTGDLTQKQITINDVAAGSDGNLNIATDDGIFIWCEDSVYRHLSRFEGIGTSNIVKTINVDAKNRVWFATSGYVGYYIDNTNPEKKLQIDIVTPKGTLIPIIMVTPIKPSPTEGITVSPPPDEFSITGVFARIIDPITRAINAMGKKFGVNIFS